MDKKRYIKQRNFRDNTNGYDACNGGFDTRVNWGLIGLEFLYLELTYHIR